MDAHGFGRRHGQAALARLLGAVGRISGRGGGTGTGPKTPSDMVSSWHLGCTTLPVTLVNNVFVLRRAQKPVIYFSVRYSVRRCTHTLVLVDLDSRSSSLTASRKFGRVGEEMDR